MNLKFIPLATPDLRGNEARYLTACVTDNWVSSAGPQVEALEIRMAEYAQCGHGVATVNGTAALYLALRAAGVAPGATVALPDWTFAATVNAVLMAGAKPIFLDVTKESWTLDPELLQATLAEIGAVAAVIAVDALGHPADMDAIGAVCAGHGIPLIEDAAGAIGACYKGRQAGSLGDIGIFSFNGNKTITAGGGGMVITDNESWANRARAISAQARKSTAYQYLEAGFNFRMPNVNAALALAQFERLDEMIAAKRAIAARYDDALAGRADLLPMPRANWAESCCWLYSVRCADPETADGLVGHLREDAIEARIFWQALSRQAPYAHAERRLTGVAESLSGTVVSLPCSSHLAESDQGRVLASLERWNRPGAKAAI